MHAVPCLQRAEQVVVHVVTAGVHQAAAGGQHLLAGQGQQHGDKARR